jgi:CRP-like cAMP-binding protein
LQKYGLQLSDSDIALLMADVDEDGSLQVEFEEFHTLLDRANEMTEREMLFSRLRMATHRAGSMLYEQGDLSDDNLYFILTGNVRVVEDGHSGDVLGQACTFGAFGFAPLELDDLGRPKPTHRKESILCMTDCVFVTLSRAAFMRMTGALEQHVVAALATVPQQRNQRQISMMKECFQDCQLFKTLQMGSIGTAACRQMTSRYLRHNEVLFGQGDPAHSVYIIVSGCVRVVLNTKPVALLTAGQSFGEAGVLKQSGKRSSLIIGGPVPELLTVAVQARMARSDQTHGATLAVLSREDYLSVCLASEENIKTVLSKDSKSKTQPEIRMLQQLFCGTNFFRLLSDEILEQQCCRYMSLRTASVGETICKAGSRGDTFYITIRGFIDGQVPASGAVFSLGPGSSFGEVAVTGQTDLDRKQTATVVCRTSCIFATLTRARYLHVTGSLKATALKVLSSQPESRTMEQLEMLSELFSEVPLFEMLHFPVLLRAVCVRLTLHEYDAGQSVVQRKKPTTGNSFVLLTGSIKVADQVGHVTLTSYFSLALALGSSTSACT